jgi:glycerate kinase
VNAAGQLVVLVAPDGFKGSLPADQVASAVGAGLRAAAAAAGVPLDVVLRPVADGGECTVAMVLAAGWQAREVIVAGPTGDPVTATFALSPEGETARAAVVELAAASGLGQLPGGRPDPLGASTYGTGQLVAAALDEGVDRLVLGIGGSATTDGGTGLASALGARFLDHAGAELRPGGGGLADLAGIDVSGLDPRLRTVEVVVACDVDNPLTGRTGAAHVYAPQKGATPEQVAVLDAGLVRLAEVLRSDLGVDVEQVPGAGAAGGVGAGALAFLGARLTPGIDLLLDLVAFDEALVGADLVVTGEGSVDAQTLSGKAPMGVARRARAAGLPVLLLAGRADLDDADRTAFGDLGVVGVHALLDIEPDPSVARRDATRLLADLAARAFHDHQQQRATNPATTSSMTRSPA